MTGRSVLISGIGVAGPALAYWLLQHGFVPTLLERAPHLRTGGYVIDFWGVGFDLTDRMGLLPAIRRAGYEIQEVRIVARTGRRIGGFKSDVFREATHGRFTSLPRGELSEILYRAVEGRAESIFGDTVAAMDQSRDGVRVQFASGAFRRFDLVIGADGLHSRVRTLAFGAAEEVERFLGYIVAAFEIAGYRPRDEDVYVGFSAPGRQAARFAMRGDRTMVLLVAAEDEPGALNLHDRAAHEAYLRDRFSGLGWECSRILGAMSDASEIYFDRVSQIRMARWALGRVALVGDAACAPSLLAGQGSALALIGAYVLAGELSRATRAEDAFARYESFMRPFVERKQHAAERFARAFAPRTRLGLTLRNLLSTAFAFRIVRRFATTRSLLDDLDLPDYAA